jgi:hypothetical protein
VELLRKVDKTPWNPVVITKPFSVRDPPKTLKSEVQLVRRKIGRLIENDISLAAKFLRLAFHDSVGGADGCVSYIVEEEILFNRIFKLLSNPSLICGSRITMYPSVTPTSSVYTCRLT